MKMVVSTLWKLYLNKADLKTTTTKYLKGFLRGNQKKKSYNVVGITLSAKLLGSPSREWLVKETLFFLDKREADSPTRKSLLDPK